MLYCITAENFGSNNFEVTFFKLQIFLHRIRISLDIFGFFLRFPISLYRNFNFQIVIACKAYSFLTILLWKMSIFFILFMCFFGKSNFSSAELIAYCYLSNFFGHYCYCYFSKDWYKKNRTEAKMAINKYFSFFIRFWWKLVRL